MERTEHTNLIQSLAGMINPDNQADAPRILTQLSEDYGVVLDENATFKTSNEELTNKNDELRKANADLFLKVGNTSTENKKQTMDKKETEGEEIPSFDTLFNEKGELI